MHYSFTKMEGAGNDFIVIQGSPPKRDLAIPLIKAMCCRRFGVGADGVFWMQQVFKETTSFHFEGYCSDGSDLGVCINAFRCAAMHAVNLRWTGPHFLFKASNRQIEARVGGSEVSIYLSGPQAVSRWTSLPSGSPAMQGYPVIMGESHLILRLEPELFHAIDFDTEARKLRYWGGVFNAGSNVHFLARSENIWNIRSYETGVESETRACGSGCMAAALALVEDNLDNETEFKFLTRGGSVIRVRPSRQNWEVIGPAQKIFIGEWLLPKSLR